MAQWLGQSLTESPLWLVVLVLVIALVGAMAYILFFWEGGGQIIDYWRRKNGKK